MIIYSTIAALFLLAVVIAILLVRRRRRREASLSSLDGFNFDKQKSYEKDGRKYPFSY